VYRHLGNVIKIPLLLFGERVNEDLIVPPAIKESARKREGKTVRNKKGVPIRICQFRKRTEKKKEGENGLSCAKFGRGQPSALLGWCTRTIYTHVHISVALVCVFAHVVYSVVCVLSCVEFILPARSPSLSLARSLSALRQQNSLGKGPVETWRASLQKIEDGVEKVDFVRMLRASTQHNTHARKCHTREYRQWHTPPHVPPRKHIDMRVHVREHTAAVPARACDGCARSTTHAAQAHLREHIPQDTIVLFGIFRAVLLPAAAQCQALRALRRAHTRVTDAGKNSRLAAEARAGHSRAHRRACARKTRKADR